MSRYLLSLFTATENPDPFLKKIPNYREALKSVLSTQASFEIFFKGVTASPSAVMVQGFTLTDSLSQLRDRLRDTLHERGLGEALDQRYRIQTAHSTIMRFQKLPRSLPLLLDKLTKFRSCDLGQTEISKLYLVKHDWYMSPNRVEILEEYNLKQK